MFIQNIANDESLESIFEEGTEGLDVEFGKLTEWWKNLMNCSFQKVSRGKKVKAGICEDVKVLLEQERWIKLNVPTNPERGRMIHQVRKQINEKISINKSREMEESVKKMLVSSNPYTEVFKIRKNLKLNGM